MVRSKMMLRVENGDGDIFSLKVKMIIVAEIGESGSNIFSSYHANVELNMARIDTWMSHDAGCSDGS